MKRLLYLGISPNVCGGLRNRTPLHSVAYHDNTDMAQLLFEHNPDIEARDEDNRTPLHFTALRNSTGVAQLLLKRNPDIEARDKYSRTPLHDAA